MINVKNNYCCLAILLCLPEDKYGKRIKQKTSRRKENNLILIFSFHCSVSIPLESNLWFCKVSRGYEIIPVAWNGLSFTETKQTSETKDVHGRQEIALIFLWSCGIQLRYHAISRRHIISLQVPNFTWLSLLRV